jgi:hypothetical protein
LAKSAAFPRRGLLWGADPLAERAAVFVNAGQSGALVKIGHG